MILHYGFCFVFREICLICLFCNLQLEVERRQEKRNEREERNIFRHLQKVETKFVYANQRFLEEEEEPSRPSSSSSSKLGEVNLKKDSILFVLGHSSSL